ncbi:MAG: isoprenylcysteine carboxylmethyltransferase family protein [Rhizobiaceae bacterium]
MFDFLASLLGWLLIACQAWSVKYHFNVQKMPVGAKLISLLVFLSGILLTYLAFSFGQPMAAQIVGVVLLAGSLSLFWRTISESKKARLLAAFDDDLPHGLLTTGPYRYVRHPFYTSYILHWVGWAVAAWHIWALVPAIAMVTTYWVAARDEEAKFNRTEMSQAYSDYRAKTGRFFPKLFR